MSGLDQRYNFVCFRIADIDDDPDDPLANRVTLKLSQDWKRTAGIRPDVNVATCPFAEFDKLQTFVPLTFVGDQTPTAPADNPSQFHREGSIEFYFSDPDTPDVVIDNITIIQAEPSSFGVTPIQQTDAETGDQSTAYVKRAVVYELWFADFRHKLQPPRGGRLFLGQVNAEGTADADLIKNSFMILKCLRALRLGDVNVPAQVDNVPPMRGLQWMGAIPIEELGKLLDYVGCTLVPTTDLTEMIQVINLGDDPVIDPGSLITDVESFNTDRRGKTVIVTSAPTPIIDAYDGQDVDGPSFEFVARDAGWQWQPLDQVPDLDGNPLLAFQNGFPDAADEGRRQILWSDCYRFLRLVGSGNAPLKDENTPILRTHLTPAEQEEGVKDIQVIARCAVVQPNGKWKNSVGEIAQDVPWMSSGIVLGLSERLGLLESSDEADHFGPDNFIEQNVFKVRFSIEAWDQTGSQKLYFHVGFTQAQSGEGTDQGGGDGLAQLDDSTVTSMINGDSGDDQDVVIIHMPELRYIRPNGKDDDDAKAALTALARARAAQVISGSDQPQKTRLAVGFIDSQINGRVSSIIYSQEKLTTTFKLNQ